MTGLGRHSLDVVVRFLALSSHSPQLFQRFLPRGWRDSPPPTYRDSRTAQPCFPGNPPPDERIRSSAAGMRDATKPRFDSGEHSRGERACNNDGTDAGQDRRAARQTTRAPPINAPDLAPALT